MSDRVTRGQAENVQDAQGTFNFKANSAGGVSQATPVDGPTLPAMNIGAAPAPTPIQIPYINAVESPQSLNLEPLAQGIEQLTQQYEAKRNKLEIEKEKHLGYAMTFEHLSEINNFLETGLDRTGKPISNTNLYNRQISDLLKAGISPELAFSISATSRGLLENKHQNDIASAKAEARKLEESVTDAAVTKEMITFHAERSKRLNVNGAVDLPQGEDQIREIVKRYPAEQQPKLMENLYKQFYKEVEGSDKQVERSANIAEYSGLVEQYKSSGLDEFEAKQRATNDMLASGADMTNINQYIKNNDGTAISLQRIKDQQVQNQIQTEKTIKVYLDRLDPSSPDFMDQLTAPKVGLLQDPSNTKVLEELLLKDGSLKAQQVRSVVIGARMDYAQMTKLAHEIEQYKSAQADVKPSKGKVTKSVEDFRCTGVVDSQAWVNPEKHILKPGLIVNGEPTDMGRILLNSQGRQNPLGVEVKPTPVEIAAYKKAGIEPPAEGYTPYFNPDGSFTLEGAEHYKDRTGVVDLKLIQALREEAGIIEADGSTNSLAESSRADYSRKISAATNEYERLHRKYVSGNGKALDAFPSLSDRLSHKQLYRGVNPLLQSSAPIRAGQESILDATNKLLGTNTSGGPDGGNLACAWMMSKVFKLAGVPGFKSTSSTVEFQKQLADGIGTRTDWDGAQAGDVIVVPAHGGIPGHIGVFTDNGRTIASNSSDPGVFKPNYTASGWKNHYSRPGDQTYIYKINGDVVAHTGKQQSLIAQGQASAGASRISQLIPVITKQAKSAGIPPSVVVAQAMLESGHGESPIARKQNNYFGVTNNGEGTGFRNYESPMHSISDQIKRLTSGRYAQLVGSLNPAAWARGLQRLGYAGGDQQYAEKLMAVIAKFGLTALDSGLSSVSKAAKPYVPEIR